MPDLSNIVPKGMILRGVYSTPSSPAAVSIFGGGSATSTLLSIVVQSDDKFIVSGGLTSWNGSTVGRIARVGTDGTFDTAFTTANGTGSNSGTTRVALQPDGKIIVYGAMTSWNGTTVGYIVRLNSDGSLDTAFTTANGTGASSTINEVAFQSDGKIILGGSFTTWNGTAAPYIARLNSDGSLDTSFTTANGTGPNSTINAVAVQSDNKIIIGGNLTSWNGTTVGYFARLNSDGSLDTAFVTANGTGANSFMSNIAVQSDGKIVAGTPAGFSSWNGTTVGYIVRLNSDGSLDTAFTTANGTGASGGQDSLAIQADGKIVIAGNFSSWNGTTVGRIARLNTDGSLDTAFVTATGTGLNSTTNAIAFQSDGKILLGGAFSLWNDVNFGTFVRISSSGSVVGAYEMPVDVVFAIVAGAGGAGGPCVTNAASGGGGAGAVVWGLVPAVDTCSVGARTSGPGTSSRYSTLYAEGGRQAGTSGTTTASSIGSLGSAASGSGVLSTNVASAGAAGSALFLSVGGDGAAGTYAASGNVTGINGVSATSGGGGGGAKAGASLATVVAGSGGSGLAGGGGGGALSTTQQLCTGGAGGGGLFGAGTAGVTPTLSTTAIGGSGGSGILGLGASAPDAISVVGDGGNGGLGGGGGGGSAGSGASGGLGGNGCVLIYW